ncbi:MAG: bifunctional phosphopantothenoylcysteine decarboxylase/phosphopantothenate--cysteine ligase CoaBC [Candidatus Azobacteroides pseudotrichonymphae]|jgi:phosphopantothenoylcysteine decarboxylase/phosphopantothenate--cysteine ligase|nr:MAG: bifunctional phosphopantothenoylcysteine decarboxylase/phosphopantothenate--cysteine ligase CoaBC [Candidatus Azobacteroides pseudotrichonymphae]
MMDGKKIVLGITGSIAAYKAAYLARALVKKGVEIQIVMTPKGKEFITPVTLSALTQKPVVIDFFAANEGTWHSHVNLGLWADAMLIAPATASTIGKMANGIASNMLITTYLSMRAPVFVAPAMDSDMFIHPTTQYNIDKLQSYGNHIIFPTIGYLASSLEGKGRMEEPDTIVKIIEYFFEKKKQLIGKKILINAGPTHERIDPTRYISNYSSGKMGFALAEECAERGAKVILVSGPVRLKTIHPNIFRIDVESAEEMYNATLSKFSEVDIGILCAAVADYKPLYYSENKIKHKANEPFSLELTSNLDIALALGKMKKSGQILVGFALETENELSNSIEKLQKKNLDFIVLNSLKEKGSGFQTNTNKITIINMIGKQKEFPLKSKKEVAIDIVDYILSL